MPRHDPIPPSRDERAYAWARYRRLMRWMALAAIGAALIALLWLWQTVGPLPIHMMIATALGVGLSVLLGTALMGLVFLSAGIGQDDAASGRGDGEP